MQKRHECRIKVDVLSRYRTGSGVAHQVWVHDLSRKGCMLHQNFSALDPGKHMTIRLDTIGPIDAVVRWVDGLRVGIEFTHPLHPSMMDQIVARFAAQSERADPVPPWVERWRVGQR